MIWIWTKCICVLHDAPVGCIGCYCWMLWGFALWTAWATASPYWSDKSVFICLFLVHVDGWSDKSTFFLLFLCASLSLLTSVPYWRLIRQISLCLSVSQSRWTPEGWSNRSLFFSLCVCPAEPLVHTEGWSNKSFSLCLSLLVCPPTPSVNIVCT